MNRLVTILAVLGTSVLLVQCTAKKTATATMSPEQIVADVKKNYTEAQMEEGKTIFESKCNKCHGLKEPEHITVNKWERVLPRMSDKAKLDEAQSGKVRAYVLAHAKVQ